MTPTEKKYRKNLGKLLVWTTLVWTREGYKDATYLAMPTGVDIRAGWWFYTIDYIGTDKQQRVAAKSFVRSSKPYDATLHTRLSTDFYE
jgi:hypothetical protein